MEHKQENKKPKSPNDISPINISDSLKITDVKTKEVIIEKKNDKSKH